ncbi:MAG: heavy metal translocating P-type ATPase, partial [Salaquimonas sp.]
YVRIADRMAKLYAPAVHLLALFAFIGWMFSTGGDWHQSLYIAIAVLIITCPCALGLAVPVVHVIGAGKLFEHGILMKDGSALERLAEVDYIVFDKTGTLTQPKPVLAGLDLARKEDGLLAATLAGHSLHPISKAIARHFGNNTLASISNIKEIAGKGVEGEMNGKILRLGNREWVSEIAAKSIEHCDDKCISFAVENQKLSQFYLNEEFRDGAIQTIKLLQDRHFEIEILSGDQESSVSQVAFELGIANFKSKQTPADKIDRIYKLRDEGHQVLMVGDGLNDTPSLAAGHASMAPASASDIGRQAADFVFTRNNLEAIPFAVKTASKARDLIRTNFALAIMYNCIAVPLAVTGNVTPLFAAIAMSASSIVVVLNSMRLTFGESKKALVSSKSQRLGHLGEAL